METTKQTTKTKWAVDPAHSEINFKVKHLMISNVKGEFKDFQIDMMGENLEDASGIKVNIQTGSISTNNSDRDAHLRSEDFFHVDEFPSMTFLGESLTKIDDDEFILKGELSIKDVTKPIELKVEFGGQTTDPYGNEKLGFSVSGKISRKEWGLNWNAVLEAGGVMVSDEVKLSAEVQLVKQA